MERRWSDRPAETIWKQHGLNDTGFRPIVQHENEDGDSGQNEPSPALPPSLKLWRTSRRTSRAPSPTSTPEPSPALRAPSPIGWERVSSVDPRPSTLGRIPIPRLPHWRQRPALVKLLVYVIVSEH